MSIKYMWLVVIAATAISYLLSMMGYAFLAILTYFWGVAALTKISSERNLFHLMWLLGLYVFVCCPLVIFVIVDYDFNFGIAVLVQLISAVAIRVTDKRDFIQIRKGQKGDYYFFGVVFFSVLTIVLGLVIGKSAYYYLYPALVVLYSMSLARLSLLKGTFAYMVLVCVFFVYCFFVWGGFGRLVIASWILIPSLIYLFSYNLYFNKWLFFLGASVASIFMSMLRFSGAEASNILQYVMKDSTTSPYRLADQIIGDYPGVGGGIGFQGVADQYLLFFVGAFPREIWESKPLGFGALYTIDNLSERLVDAGHSVAALFVGEHIYYVGYFWGGFFALLATLLVCFLYRLAYRLSPASQVLAIPVALYVTSFFWVGLATYSQRLQQGFFLICAAWLVLVFIKKGFGK